MKNNMKKTLVILFTVIMPNSLNAQFLTSDQLKENKQIIRDETNEFISEIQDSMLRVVDINIVEAVKTETNRQLMSDRNFNRYLRNILSQIVYSKDEIPQATSVSLVSASNDTRLNFNFMKGCKYSAFGAGAELNYDGSTAQVFSDQNVLPNTAYFLNGYIGLFKSSFLRYREPSWDLVKAKRAVYLNKECTRYEAFYTTYNNALKSVPECDHQLEVLKDLCKNNHQGDSSMCILRLNGDTLKIKNLKDTLLIVSDLNEVKIKCNCCPNPTCEYLVLKDSLETAKHDALEALEAYKDLADPAKEIENRTEKIENSVYEIETKAKITFIKLMWINYEIKYNKDQYNTIDVVDLQNYTIGTKGFDRFKLSGTMNWYVKKPIMHSALKARFLKGFYGSLSYTGSNDNSYGQLAEKKFSVARQIQQNDTITSLQVTEQLLRNINGVEYKKSWAHSINLNAVFGVSDNDLVGISVGIRGKYSSFTYPSYTPKLGLVFKFLDKEKTDKSKITFEFFGSVENAFEANPEKNFGEKFQLGLNTKIPLSKLLF